MSTTEDPKDPRLGYGVDAVPVPMNETYLVLSEAERAQGYVRPLRRTYVHETCGVATTMGHSIAATYAVKPGFYGATYCVGCAMHRPVGEFRWDDGSVVGS